MKEFMFYITNAPNAKMALRDEMHLAFVKKCEVYIDQLQKEGRLIAAQPIFSEGVIVSKTNGNWTEAPAEMVNQVRVGYYHIKAENIEEAIAIAKQNPEFEYIDSAKIEIHQVKVREEKTNFVYPK